MYIALSFKKIYEPDNLSRFFTSRFYLFIYLFIYLLIYSFCIDDNYFTINLAIPI